ncbi:threonylcarbamoyladenosine tRNA methylthiotransferase [Senna tora]|uniref:Threonylcarbamoyladenosine tRNA methylthiotransferase n=1 Tax=Senna tora TaxID=362788 RepID=A0A834X2N5_9FABA|nr:threonylcarbamoyladenosine tRNA methylthiotransferase [Senna tora]
MPMEDIEDLLIGSETGSPPGFRLPLKTVGVNPKRNRTKLSQIQDSASAVSLPKIPGTQTIFIKTFGCSHNQSDSEYMAGQLSAFEAPVPDPPKASHFWLGLCRCTVKSPSQSAMDTIIGKGKSSNKPLGAGCVPQGSRGLKELEGISIVGVQQIDRVVEVVEETLKGHEVRLLTRKTLPALDLPKVSLTCMHNSRAFCLEISSLPSVLCFVHARGHLGSYSIDSLVGRLRSVIADGVKEIWLSSEDTGAYGRDIGVNLPTLLNALVKELPADASSMLRIGMTNPPFILEHLKDIAEIMRHPCVYSFLHVPVQSGIERIWILCLENKMLWNLYKIQNFQEKKLSAYHLKKVISWISPGETDDDFAQTVSLIKDYKFPQVHISQFYPRPGTPAARMKKVPSNVVKKRSRELTNVFESFTPYTGMEGKVERIWITDVASDGIHLVGHTKGYIQVLVAAPDSMLGTSAMVKITSVGRWSVFGQVIETLNHISDNRASSKKTPNHDMSSLCNNASNTGKCFDEPDSCACGNNSCCNQSTLEKSDVSRDTRLSQNSRNFIGWILRKRKHLHKRTESELTSRSIEKQDGSHGSMKENYLVPVKALAAHVWLLQKLISCML